MDVAYTPLDGYVIIAGESDTFLVSQHSVFVFVFTEYRDAQNLMLCWNV